MANKGLMTRVCVCVRERESMRERQIEKSGCARERNKKLQNVNCVDLRQTSDGMGCYSPTLGRRREFENLIYLKVTHPPECTHTHTPEGLPRGRMGCVHEGECST